MTVSKRAIDAFLARDMRSFQWLKKERREDLVRAIADFDRLSRFKTEPWTHQLVCHYIGLCYPRFLFLLDMGLGKSKILLDLLTHALRSKSATTGLVVVPRLINVASWADAIAEHSDLAPNLIDCEDIGEKRSRLMNPRGDISVVDYHGLTLALTRKEKKKLVADPAVIDAVAKAHQFIGIDESHKVATTTSIWFDVVDRLSARARHVHATTGTLIGKNVQRAWPQFYIVDRGETLGETEGLFQASFFNFKAGPFKTTAEFDKRKSRRLHVMLQNRSIRYDDDEVHDLPMLVNRKRIVEMASDQADHYARAVDGVIALAGSEPSKQGAPWLRMRHITAGFLSWKDEYGDHLLPFARNPKLDMLETMLVDELVDSKVVVVHHYTPTGAMIMDRLTKTGVEAIWLHGGTKDKADARRRFLEPSGPRVLVMNDDFGTGIDELQHVARYMIFYESPTPPDTRRQTEKRIHRPGQRERCFVYDLIARSTVDGGILRGIAEGYDLHDVVVAGRMGKGRMKGLLLGI